MRVVTVAIGVACVVLPAINTFAALGPSTEVPPDLGAFQAAIASQRPTAEREDLPTVRAEALREVALGAAARSGLARRTYEIRQRLNQSAPQLDAVYNFRALLVLGNVLPPVLLEATGVFQQDGDRY